MSLKRLKIHNLRNISSAELFPSAGLNIIFGDNASGKTSLLEAIFLVSRGKSFRAPKLSAVIQSGERSLSVFGSIEQIGGIETGVGIQHDIRQGLSMRVGGRPLRATSDLVRIWPLQVVHPGSQLVLDGGPRFRRRYLDWGVFHVKPFFYEAWQRYQRALKQRNAHLRAKHSGVLSMWDQELDGCARTIHQCRASYVETINGSLGAYVDSLLNGVDIGIDYHAGWNTRRTLREQLLASEARDRQIGYTSSGPHRADLRLTSDGVAVTQRLSRGQQKLCVIALHLAQVAVLRSQVGGLCGVLIDDLPSELDAQHRERLMILLRDLEVQVFVTAMEPNRIHHDGWKGVKLFHVEHGKIIEA